MSREARRVGGRYSITDAMHPRDTPGLAASDNRTLAGDKWYTPQGGQS